MKKPKEEFIKLQQHWYDILAKSGFEDIEQLKGSKLILTPLRDKFDGNTRSNFWSMDKEQYFRLMSHAVHDIATVFRNEVDKFILVRWVEGARIKIIVEELLNRETPRERKTVRFIIRRYEHAWKIKPKADGKKNG